MSTRYLPFIFIIAIVFASCKARVNPEKPDYAAITKRYKQEVSNINIPFEISVKELQTQINKELPTVLFEDDSYTNNGNDDLKLKITKTDGVRLRIDNNVIYYTIPIRVWVKMRKVIFGQEFSKSTAFGTIFKFKTAIDIDDQWNMETKTTALDYLITEEPELHFGPLAVPLTPIIRHVFNNYLDNMADILDEELKNSLSIREYMQETYEYIQSPVLLDEDYGTWLSLKPKSFYRTSFASAKQKLRFDLGLRTYIDVYVGDKPKKVNIDKELPDLKKVSKVKDEFQIAVASEITFDQATKIVKSNLVGYEYEYGKRKKIEVTDAEIFGVGNKLGVRVSLAGNLEGDVYMIGTPKYDSTTSELYIDNFGFDIKSKKVVLKVADWLVSGPFKNKVKKMMRIPLKESVKETSDMIAESLKNNPMAESVYLLCTIHNIVPLDIYMTDHSLKMMIQVEGKARVKLGD